jgi:NADH-quinone oxidoreductase subunit G
MVVHLNHSTKAVANQKQVMEYLLINHPLDCPVCDQAGECYLQDYSYQYGRSQSRFEEDKHKKPKKDVGLNVILYNDRCIMCTRCVRFTREVSGTGELFVDGRGAKEEIEIFPGKPLNNKLSGNVVDLCPVGALLDKDFLFKQRVWLLKRAPSVSPVDAGGENIYLEYNEGYIYRVKPRYNPDVNTWWITDDTRYSYKAVHDEKRLNVAMKTQYGTQVAVDYATAINTAADGIRNLVKESGEGSAYAMLSPMMACEEAFLLATWIRSVDPQAVLVLGPVPTTGENEVFKHYTSGKVSFTIQAEKVPNKNGVLRVMDMLGGPRATFDEFAKSESPELKKLKGGWIVGGYLSNWLPKDLPALFKRGFKVVQDILPTTLSTTADVLLPAAAWAEKDGTWENYQNRLQAFTAAVAPPEGARKEGQVYLRLLDQPGQYDAKTIRTQMGAAFAEVAVAAEAAEEPAFEFAEL